jgi:hypothetical protein
MPDEQPNQHGAAPARLAKLLPADLTAAFLSAKAGLIASMGEPNADQPIFWTFVGILLISPFYFRWVTKTRAPLEIAFLSATFIIFAISIAEPQFASHLGTYPVLAGINYPLNAVAIVAPILWIFLVAPIVEDYQARKAP